MKTFWISFADKKHLGCCIIEAENGEKAIEKTHELGINPGGEALWNEYTDIKKAESEIKKYGKNILISTETLKEDGFLLVSNFGFLFLKHSKLTLILTLLSLFSFSQVESIKRYNERPDISTKVPSKPMKFNYQGDTLFVSIYADSLKSSYDVKLFVRFPETKSITGYSVSIGFPDGSYEVFNQIAANNNYAEFPVNMKAQNKLRETKFDIISFESKGLSEPCVNIKDKEFFRSFFKAL